MEPRPQAPEGSCPSRNGPGPWDRWGAGACLPQGPPSGPTGELCPQEQTGLAPRVCLADPTREGQEGHPSRSAHRRGALRNEALAGRPRACGGARSLHSLLGASGKATWSCLPPSSRKGGAAGWQLGARPQPVWEGPTMAWAAISVMITDPEGSPGRTPEGDRALGACLGGRPVGTACLDCAILRSTFPRPSVHVVSRCGFERGDRGPSGNGAVKSAQPL